MPSGAYAPNARAEERTSPPVAGIVRRVRPRARTVVYRTVRPSGLKLGAQTVPGSSTRRRVRPLLRSSRNAVFPSLNTTRDASGDQLGDDTPSSGSYRRMCVPSTCATKISSPSSNTISRPSFETRKWLALGYRAGRLGDGSPFPVRRSTETTSARKTYDGGDDTGAGTDRTLERSADAAGSFPIVRPDRSSSTARRPDRPRPG